MPDSRLIEQLAALTDLPGVRERAESVREAAARLRFHEALRRRVAEAAAESRVRGAGASARLDGAQLPLQAVRDLVRGARDWPTDPDPAMRVVRGAVTATAETEHVVGLVRTAPLQALARLHVAAAGHLLAPDAVGRPRVDGETCDELVDLGPAPPAGTVSARLAQVSEVVVAGASSVHRVPAVVVAAVVHAEVAVVRPFARGNGLVARAFERALVQASGLDPTGVAVPEAGHAAAGAAAYLGALTAYAEGSAAGVALWLGHCADALLAAVQEGERICDAVRLGRLT
ncbi:MAG TPA: hypothetical protein VFJ94_09285 [Intrasporangium sp.]|uniref:hypothetical protein n=1 Tax=Intrasporangium sp. TaxID=1925024 RepID=UPI002D770281|nr:hypothetical protein [Intrasporangium sp.]HET7398700.1 hypothetical protein [Intrasporangium sp.]